MTPIQITVPESLTAQKAELESALAGIATDEQKLAAQRKDIQTALQSISTAVAILSGQPLPANKAVAGIATARKPMSEEAKKRIGEGLRKAREAKKAAQIAGAVPAPQASAPALADAQVAAPAPQEPAPAPADVPVAGLPPRKREAPGRRRRSSGTPLGESLLHNGGALCVCPSSGRGT